MYFKETEVNGIKNEQYFEEIYSRYFPDVYNFLYGLCGNSDISEELTQDTFVAAYRSLHKYNGKCKIYTWLCAIAKNMWFHYIRKHKHACIDIESLSETLLSEEPSPQDKAESEERLNEILKAVKSLKSRQRDIFWLHTVAEMPFSEIANIVGITENSAKVIYFRAKNILRKQLIHADENFSEG